MTYTEKAIHYFGHEDARTRTIAFLEEQGKTELAEELWNILVGEDTYEEYEPDWDECGFDPYEGCYTYDC